MAIEITNNYSNYTSGYANAANSKKQAAESKAATQKSSIGESGLSKRAQALLEKLRKRHGGRGASGHMDGGREGSGVCHIRIQ